MAVHLVKVGLNMGLSASTKTGDAPSTPPPPPSPRGRLTADELECQEALHAGGTMAHWDRSATPAGGRQPLPRLATAAILEAMEALSLPPEARMVWAGPSSGEFAPPPGPKA